MCFMLYMAADQSIPTILWDEHNPSLHTEDLNKNNLDVARHLSKKHKKYVGSDSHCGCGFRNAMLQGGEWPEEMMGEWGMLEDDDLKALEEKQINHQQLYGFIRNLLPTGGEIELYGEDIGGFEKPSEIQSSTIPLSKILEKNFYFRDCYRYVVIYSW